MPPNAFFFSRTRDLLVSQKTTQRHFFSTLHPLFTVIFATATILAFVLLRDSRFNFHCYTQREATPTQKSARKCAATSCNFLHKRLQSAFTLANQLCRIAQYWPSDTMSIISPSLKLSSSVSWASYAYRQEHCGSLGLGVGLGLGLGRPPPGAGRLFLDCLCCLGDNSQNMEKC